MDLVLNATDGLVFDALYPSVLPSGLYESYFASSSNTVRQITSIWLLEMVGVLILYFGGSTLSYVTWFDHSIKKHPKYLKNQIAREIWLSVSSFPITATVTVPWLFFEVNGYSKLYSSVDEYGLPYLFLSMLGFILFTDFGVYWIHRIEHHPALYSWLHKQHHAWKVCTPYASFAFHPLVILICAGCVPVVFI